MPRRPFAASASASAAAALLLSSFLLTVVGVGAIYPPDHFEYSTRLASEDELKDFVRRAVEDEGKTAIVRWIASPG